MYDDIADVLTKYCPVGYHVVFSYDELAYFLVNDNNEKYFIVCTIDYLYELVDVFSDMIKRIGTRN